MYYSVNILFSLGMIFLPAFLFVIFLFPRQHLLQKLALAGGFAILLNGIVVLILSHLPIGLRYHTFIIANLGLNIILMILLWKTGFLTYRQLLYVPKQPDKRLLPLFAIISGVLFIIMALPLSQLQKESYTEFYIVEGFSDAPPWQRPVQISESVPLTLVVTSSERSAEEFEIRMIKDEEAIESLNLGKIAPGQSLNQLVVLPPRKNPTQRYDLVLYKGDMEAPYRILSIWLRTQTR